ncbi:MAG: hypothetical protein AAGE76_01520 [Pseudomonadota bacterium]
MLLSLDGQFAYLAMTKTGSTSVENALRPHCQVMFTGDHRVTHMPGHHFERYVRPYLLETGQPPIDSVAQIRHPVDWLESWWRYRGRDAGPQSTRGIGFDQFADEFMAGADRPYLGLHRPHAFFYGEGTDIQVDLVFRFEEMALFQRFLEMRLGRPVTIERHNVSPTRWLKGSRAVRRRLETFLTPEMELWEGATRSSLQGLDPRPA